MAEKRTLYFIEEESTRYTPVAVGDFLKNTLRELQKKASLIEENAPKKQETQEGYITILGAKNIENKIRVMLESARERIYVMADIRILSCFQEEIRSLIESGKKVVVLSDFGDFSLEDSFFVGVIFYKTETGKNEVLLIVD